MNIVQCMVESRHTGLTQRKLSFAYPALFETLARIVLDRNLYESAEEPKPKPTTIFRASKALGNAVSRQHLLQMEIDPYWGEIHVTWRGVQGKRIKAIFEQDDSLSIYHEQDWQGRLEYRVERNQTDASLGTWLQWVYA